MPDTAPQPTVPTVASLSNRRNVTSDATECPPTPLNGVPEQRAGALEA